MELSWLIWHFTNKCNFSCSFCYTRSHPKADYGLDTTDILKVIDKINNSTVSIVSLIGGEPLIRRDINKIIDAFSDRIRIKIDSNGSLIRSNWSESLNKIKYFNIGIDGKPSSNEIDRKYTDRVVDAISFLLDKGKHVNIPFLVTKKNHVNFIENLEYILSLNPNYVQVNLFGDVLESEKNEENKLTLKQEVSVLKELEIFLKQNPEKREKIQMAGWKNNYYFENYPLKNAGPCLCGIYRASISNTGHLLPCPVLSNYISEFTDDVVLLEQHNIVNNEILDILKTDLFSVYANRASELPTDCLSCQFKEKCNHGCRSFNLISEGIFPGNKVKDCSKW